MGIQNSMISKYPQGTAKFMIEN